MATLPNRQILWADRLAWGAGVVTALASLSGLVLPGLYRDSKALVNLTRADDAFRLVAVVPILALGLWAGARGSIVARLFAMGALACLVYLYGFLTTAAAVNAASLSQIAALGLAFWSLALSLLGVQPHVVETAIGGRLLRRTSAAVLLALAALSALNWGAVLLGSAISGNPPADVARLGLATNPLYAIELAFLVPLLIVAGLQLLRRDPSGLLLGIPLLTLLVLLGLGLAWEAAGAAVAGGTFDGGQAAAGLIFVILPALLLAPLMLRRGSPIAASDVGPGAQR